MCGVLKACVVRRVCDVRRVRVWRVRWVRFAVVDNVIGGSGLGIRDVTSRHVVVLFHA